MRLNIEFSMQRVRTKELFCIASGGMALTKTHNFFVRTAQGSCWFFVCSKGVSPSVCFSEIET